jgi:GNAT superfamily N-acetyltransferase
MEPATVTVAGPADLDAVVASVAGLFREDGGRHDPAMNVDWPLHGGAGYYGPLLSDPSARLAVARDGDRVVGHLVGKVLEPDAMRTRRLAVLESMRVDPGHRGRGVGGLLVEHFLGWARERDARDASVTAFVANENAQRLYRRYGFAPASVILRTTL